MSLLRKLLAEKPVRTPLDFGINENVRLIKIDNEERKRDGEILKRNTYLTFAKFNSKNEIIASSEFNYFDLDPESDYIHDNLATQVAQLNNLVSVLNPGSVVDPTIGYNDMEELSADLQTKKGCKKLMDETWKQFEKAVKKHIGLDSKLLRIKIVTEKKGKYLQLPKDAIFVESMEVDSNDSVLRIQPYELQLKNNALNNVISTQTPDEPGKKPTSSRSIINI